MMLMGQFLRARRVWTIRKDCVQRSQQAAWREAPTALAKAATAAAGYSLEPRKSAAVAGGGGEARSDSYSAGACALAAAAPFSAFSRSPANTRCTLTKNTGTISSAKM